MNKRIWRYAVIVSLAAACLGQSRKVVIDPETQQPVDVQAEDTKLPNGKSQKDEILKSEHAQNLKDADELVQLSEELRDSLAKNDRYVLSLADLKKTEDIEKLVKKIRGRLRRN
jgi:cell division septation protein DedD